MKVSELDEIEKWSKSLIFANFFEKFHLKNAITPEEGLKSKNLLSNKMFIRVRATIFRD